MHICRDKTPSSMKRSLKTQEEKSQVQDYPDIFRIASVTFQKKGLEGIICFLPSCHSPMQKRVHICSLNLASAFFGQLCQRIGSGQQSYSSRGYRVLCIHCSPLKAHLSRGTYACSPLSPTERAGTVKCSPLTFQRNWGWRTNRCLWKSNLNIYGFIAPSNPHISVMPFVAGFFLSKTFSNSPRDK